MIRDKSCLSQHINASSPSEVRLMPSKHNLIEESCESEGSTSCSDSNSNIRKAQK